jgi:hypothetical protein
LKLLLFTVNAMAATPHNVFIGKITAVAVPAQIKVISGC